MKHKITKIRLIAASNSPILSPPKSEALTLQPAMTPILLYKYQISCSQNSIHKFLAFLSKVAVAVMGSHVSRRSAPAKSGANTSSSNADAITQECVIAFLEMEKDATNNDKLVEFVRSHYVSRLNAAEFCSVLQRRQAANDSSIVHNFIHDLSSLYSAHSIMEKTLKSMDESFCKKLRRIGVSKKVSAVLFTSGAVICAAAAAANANANTKRAAAAGAASLLFGAVGKWVHSLLNKRERVVRRNKEVTELMIMGAKVGMQDVDSIHMVAQSLLQAANDGAAVEGSFGFQGLLEKIDYYGGEMKWVKQLVLQSITTKHLD